MNMFSSSLFLVTIRCYVTRSKVPQTNISPHIVTEYHLPRQGIFIKLQEEDRGYAQLHFLQALGRVVV